MRRQILGGLLETKSRTESFIALYIISLLYMAYFRRSKKPLGKKPVRRPRARKASIPTAIKSYVNKTINRNEETKMATQTFNIAGFNSGITTLADFNQLIPSISTGSVQNARVGVAIKPVKLVVKGYIIYKTDTNLGARMIGTRMFCFSDKSVSNYATALAAGVNYNLLDNGGTSNNFTGTALNYMQPVNKDLFKFYADKKHTILKPYGYTNTLSPGSTDLTAMDKSMYQPFTITIPASKMPKVLKYDDTLSSGFPVNFAPWLAVGYSDLLGYTADTTNTQIIMEYVSTLYYKDA